MPQILHTLSCISYSPPLDAAIKSQQSIQPGSSWEVQLRGCSIWCVELIKREMLAEHPDATINAILIDFFLYDLVRAFLFISFPSDSANFIAGQGEGEGG